MIRAYLRDASFESSSDFAPVTTILPEAKMSAVVFGSRIRMMTAAKRWSDAWLAQGEQQRERAGGCTFGLYSALRACNAMVLRSSRQSRLTVATMFLYEEPLTTVAKAGNRGILTATLEQSH